MKLKTFGGLTQQLFEKPFKNMLFSIYNFAEEEFYLHDLEKLGYDTDIDNLEYITLDLNGINYNELVMFRQYIEDELQEGSNVIGVLFYTKANKGVVPVVIKPKDVDIEILLKKE